MGSAISSVGFARTHAGGIPVAHLLEEEAAGVDGGGVAMPAPVSVQLVLGGPPLGEQRVQRHDSQQFG